MKDVEACLAEIPPRGELQANASSCFVCGTSNRWGLGASYYTVAEYCVEARICLGVHYQGHPGWVHGGVLAALLDEAMGRAMLARHPGRFLVTARFELKYLLPVPIETELTIRASITNDRRHLANAVCSAELPGRRLAVTGEGLLASPMRRATVQAPAAV